MYELAGETMAARQAKYLSYHDKKVFDDNLDEDTLVYMYVPKKSREKLLKWSGPCEATLKKMFVSGPRVKKKSPNRAAVKNFFVVDLTYF